MSEKTVSLYEIIPAAFDKFSFSDYRRGERELLTPALESMGYIVLYWADGERDSFGPLSRVAVVSKGGIKYDLVYG